jgi:hypothetical protein
VADGYQVDLTALRAAADGITRVVEQVDAHSVASLATSARALGHARLGASLAAFCDRWQAGVTHLAEDGRAAGGHLTQAANAYSHADGVGQDGYLRDPGPDPAPR